VTPEGKITRAVVAHLDKRGGVAYRSSPAMRGGTLDWVFLFKGGKHAVVEFKAPGKPLKSHQQREAIRLHELGHRVLVIDNVVDGLAWIDAYTK
jgi:hypothetical protein